jgi:hypothetical protein
MSIDYNALLYDPVYAEIGVPAMLTHTAGVSDITVIDDTRAKTNTSGPLEVRSVGPGAFARVPELTNKGVDRSDYDGSMLAFNGRIWIVRSHELRGSPNGEDQGEVRFLLRASDD